MKRFNYNIIKGLDINDNDIQWWENMSNGQQLLIPMTDEDTELKELLPIVEGNRLSKMKEVNRALALVNAKMPPIYIDMTRYIKSRRVKCLFAVNVNTAKCLFCFSSTLIDGQIPIAWNICDTCGVIARCFRNTAYSDRLLLLSQRTHITDLTIEPNEFGDIIITPTIENLYYHYSPS